MLIHGAPKHIHCDKGPEMIAKAMHTWVARIGTQMQAARVLYGQVAGEISRQPFTTVFGTAGCDGESRMPPSCSSKFAWG